MRGTSLLDRLGRAEALAGATAVVLLAAGVTGAFTRGPDEAGGPASALATARPDSTFDPLASLAPVASAAGGRRGPGQATVTGPSATLAPPPGAERVRGPASGTPVKVGIHLNDNEGAGAQFGVAGLPNISDAEVNAVVAQVNKAGGLAGRPVAPTYHRTDPLSGTFDSQGQAACETFTQDSPVDFVVDNALSPSKVMLDCIAKRKIPLIWELHMAQVTNAEAARYADYLYRPSMPNADRLDFVVDQLHADGFFKNAKVGILRYDSPEGAFMSDKVFKPRFKALKVPVIAEEAFTKPANSGGAAGLAGQSSNAVLDFKEKGVTHVFFVPTGGAIPLTFVPAAASQGYTPAYGLTSQDSPDFIGKNFSERELAKARIVGWAPDLDGDDFERGDGIARCRKAMADAGLPFDDQIQPYCDALYFMHAALYDSEVVSVASLRAGVESLGGDYVSPFVLGTRFGPRHDGPSQGRMLRYDAAKEGWKYYGDRFSFD